MYNFNEKETRTVLAVFDSLFYMDEHAVNEFLGSVTIAEMKELYLKMKYAPFCEKHGIRYEDMTDDDFIAAWEEECEKMYSSEE